MTEPISTHAFSIFLTCIVGGVSGLWMIYDARNLVRAWSLDRSDPIVRDRHFGYAMGILMGVIGVVGSLKFHGIV